MQPGRASPQAPRLTRPWARRPATAAVTTIARSPVRANATAHGKASAAGSSDTARGWAGTGAATGAAGRPLETSHVCKDGGALHQSPVFWPRTFGPFEKTKGLPGA